MDKHHNAIMSKDSVGHGMDYQQTALGSHGVASGLLDDRKRPITNATGSSMKRTSSGSSLYSQNQPPLRPSKKTKLSLDQVLHKTIIQLKE